jgi:anti-sigma factor ChrR (cupin superfamily)
VEAHLLVCGECRTTLQRMRRVVDTFAFWPTDVLRPSETLRQRLALRIAAEAGATPKLESRPRWSEPRWEPVGSSGIECKLLARDAENHRVSMLVRLAPGAEYPPHTHAGREELHLLHGELWIDDRKLYPGEYNRAEAGTADKRVWSETGCTCVLITSTEDVLGPAKSD